MALAIALAYDRRIAAIFVVAAAPCSCCCALVAALIMLVARRAPHLRSPVVRLAIANIHRPGALTPSIVLSLGLGLALLVTVIAIDGNLRRQFLAALPEKAPSFYFIDIPSAEQTNSTPSSARNAPGAMLDRVPMLRGRIVAANGMPAGADQAGAGGGLGVQSDRGITYADTVPAGSRAGRRRMVERRTMRARRCLVRETHRRWARPQARRYRHRQRARPQYHRHDRQSAHASIGRASASIS